MSESMLRPAVFVIGTRAQLIKVAPVVLAAERADLTCRLLMTGQHQDTMQDLIDEFGIISPQVPALAAAEHATVGSLVRWLPAAYRGVKACLHEIGHGANGIDVLVHGDTLSTLVGAFAARRCKARVVHLESGLTSGKLLDPFPEELCRRLVFRLTDVAMCPNAQATANMHRYPRVRAINTGGNTIIDAVALTGATDICRRAESSYLVASLHRFQNIYEPRRMRGLVEMIETVSQRFTVYFVLHPATRGRLQKDGLLQRLTDAPGVVLCPRMGYRDFLRLAAGAACVLTDGGSNQEELATLGVPTVIMRARTERRDGLGVNAIMESDIDGGVAPFILHDTFETLRKPPTHIAAEGPSAHIVRVLSVEDPAAGAAA